MTGTEVLAAVVETIDAHHKVYGSQEALDRAVVVYGSVEAADVAMRSARAALRTLRISFTGSAGDLT